eukprot:scpid83957/ scgid33627/ 
MVMELDALFRKVAQHVAEDDVAKWRKLLAFVAEPDEQAAWMEEMEKQTGGAAKFLKFLEHQALIRDDNVKLLEELVSYLPDSASKQSLIAIVRDYSDKADVLRRKRAAAQLTGDPLDQVMRRIAFEERLGSKWSILALKGLKLASSDIEEVKHKCQGSDLDSLAYEAMCLWRNLHGRTATKAKLIKALRDSQQVLIAERIEQMRDQ